MNDDRHAQLEMRWSPVTDEHGRTRMEAVWVVPTEPVRVTDAA